MWCHKKLYDFFKVCSFQSRRRANTLTVCSTVIARVIGRGGANINAIREATGASIEVEKQNAKKDQLDRLISIRGTSETVRCDLFFSSLLYSTFLFLIADVLFDCAFVVLPF